MKLLIILGSLFGFASGVFLGWMQGQEGAEILWRSSVGALVAGILMRWWGFVWIRSFRRSVEERMAELAAQRKEAKAVPARRL